MYLIANIVVILAGLCITHCLLRGKPLPGETRP